LAAVAGLWVGDGYLAEENSAGWDLVWQPRQTQPGEA